MSEIYDRKMHCGFNNPIWLDILKEEETNAVEACISPINDSGGIDD